MDLHPTHLQPHESGGIYWISFGIWWFDPQWGMSTYIFQAGEKFCYSGLPPDVLDGNWHHLAMTWDAEKGYEYKDGKLIRSFDRTDPDISKRLELYRLRLGGSVNDGQAASSVMDEVAIFQRKLTDAEVQHIAEAAAPLKATANKHLLTRGARTVFYRNEPKAALNVDIRGLVDSQSQFDLDCAIGDVVMLHQSVALRDRRGTARFDFSPTQLRCGTYPCRVGLVTRDGGAAYCEFAIEIVPALRPENYTIASWNHGGETPEWRKFSRTVGVNTIDCGGVDCEILGKNGFLYSWHCNFFESKGGVES